MKSCLRGSAVALLLFSAVAGSLATQRESRPLKTGTISGTLLTRDGKPAPGVRIAALAAPPENPDANTGASMSALSLVETDAEGRYRLEDLPAGSYLVSAGLFSAATYFPGVSEQAKARAVTVESGAHLAAIDFKLVSMSFSGRVTRTESNNPGSPRIEAVRLQQSDRVLTAPVGQDGAFAFPSLPPGEYQLATVPDISPSSSVINVTLGERDVTDFQLTLPWVAMAWSATTEQNAPLPKFSVRLIDVNASGAALTAVTTFLTPDMRVATPVLGGRPSVLPGSYRIIVDGLPKPFFVKSITNGATDLAVSPLSVTASGQPAINILLGVSGTASWPSISGRFTGRGSLAGAPIGTVSGPMASPPAIVAYLDGSFEVPRLVPGAYTFPSSFLPQAPPGFAPNASTTAGLLRSGSKEIIVGEKNVENILIDTSPAVRSSRVIYSGGTEVFPNRGSTSGPRLSGQIVGRARVVATGVAYEVRLRSGGSEWWLATPIYADGSFEFEHVPPGTYSAEVSPAIPGLIPTTFTVGAKDLEVKVAVPTTRDVIGRIEPAGAPTPRTLTFSVASQTLRVDVQPEGRFNITLPDGHAAVLAPNSLPEDFSAGSVTLVQVPGAPELRVVLKTAPTVAVRGHLRGAAGPPAGVIIALSDRNNVLRTMETTVRSDGAFEFPRVLPGIYRVQLLRAFGLSTGEVSIVVNSGEDVEGLELTPVALPAPFR